MNMDNYHCQFNSPVLVLFSGFDSMQGMEFFEGFGKKKSQQNHNNHEPSLPIDNSTQPLNIHLHGKLFNYKFNV